MSESEDISVSFNELYKLGYISCLVPPSVTQCIEVEVQRMLATNFRDCISYNSNLAGSIRHEYILTESVDYLDQFLKVVAPRYWDYWDNPNAQKEHRLSISKQISEEYGYPIKDLWVNFQKKHEINPLHHHGGDLSFVIWHKIPYEEKTAIADIARKSGRIPPQIASSREERPPGSGRRAGNFMFNYPNHNARGGVAQHVITVDKSRENTMIIFDASMQHAVYPFYTSDEYRISVSGNLEII